MSELKRLALKIMQGGLKHGAAGPFGMWAMDQAAQSRAESADPFADLSPEEVAQARQAGAMGQLRAQGEPLTRPAIPEPNPAEAEALLMSLARNSGIDRDAVSAQGGVMTSPFGQFDLNDAEAVARAIALFERAGR